MTSKHKAAPPPQPPSSTIGEEGDGKGDEEGEGDKDESEEGAAATTAVTSQKSLPQLPQQKGPDLEKETHRFRELLLFGRKKVLYKKMIYKIYEHKFVLKIYQKKCYLGYYDEADLWKVLILISISIKFQAINN